MFFFVSSTILWSYLLLNVCSMWDFVAELCTIPKMFEIWKSVGLYKKMFFFFCFFFSPNFCLIGFRVSKKQSSRLPRSTDAAEFEDMVQSQFDIINWFSFRPQDKPKGTSNSCFYFKQDNIESNQCKKNVRKLCVLYSFHSF